LDDRLQVRETGISIGNILAIHQLFTAAAVQDEKIDLIERMIGLQFGETA